MSPRTLAVIAAGFTLLLILAGGFVTSTGSGDSIPTWPLSWGRLAPIDGSPAAWIEQSHRYLAAIVGLLVGLLAIWVRVVETRPGVRRWAYLAFGAVLVQALLGGVRIFIPEFGPSARAAVAIVHAVFAQAVFGALVGLALFLSPSMKERRTDDGAASAFRIGMLTVAFAFFQLVAGAITRHTGAGIAVHLVGAGLVLLHATIFSSRLMTTSLRAGGHFLMFLIAVQVILGLSAWSATTGGATRSLEVPLSRLVTVTTHVAIGAMVLATTLVLTLKCKSSQHHAEAAQAAKAERNPAQQGAEADAA